MLFGRTQILNARPAIADDTCWFNANAGHRGDGALRILARQVHVKQRQPILKRLQSKAAKDRSDAESSEPALGKIFSIVLNVRIN